MRRVANKKTLTQKRRNKTKKFTLVKTLKYSFMVLIVAIILAASWQKRDVFLYYLGFKSDKKIESLSK